MRQAKEEEVKRKQREVEAAMRILDRLVIDQLMNNSIFLQPFHLVVVFQLWVTLTLC